MDKSDIKSKEQENELGNQVLALILIIALAFLIHQLFTSFNSEPFGEWYFYFSVIGYSWALIFVSILLFFTVRNLKKET
tara:strand:- start:504 stop:740 length:237 start_codon:yes stop_codon:yes gene_type:complete